LCDGVLNGYNATVFAYGATGAGKTYTYYKEYFILIIVNRMLGVEENPGIMFHTLKELFNRMMDFKMDRNYTIRVSFLEIYNE
jgi:kinesin family protein 18/19